MLSAAIRRWLPRFGSSVGIVGNLVLRSLASVVLGATAVAAAGRGGWWIPLAVLCGAIALLGIGFVLLMLVFWIRGDVSADE